ncbi:UNVERIFIED_CONTAM: hypothetical protein Sangu_3181300, partial [Sesamum angustifolium]
MRNGRQFDWLKALYGHRKGDPLSPHLFIMRAEVFSRLLQVAEEDGKLKGIVVARGAPRISHLLFADDSLIFDQSTTEADLCIQE